VYIWRKEDAGHPACKNLASNAKKFFGKPLGHSA